MIRLWSPLPIAATTFLFAVVVISSAFATRAHQVSLYTGNACDPSMMDSSLELAEGLCYQASDSVSFKLVCGAASSSSPPTAGSLIFYENNVECNEGDTTVQPVTKSFSNGACLNDAVDGEAASLSCYTGSELPPHKNSGGGGNGSDGDGGGSGSPAASSALEARETALQAIVGLALGFGIVVLLSR